MSRHHDAGKNHNINIVEGSFDNLCNVHIFLERQQQIKIVLMKKLSRIERSKMFGIL
jgi:hypothetical protein